MSNNHQRPDRLKVQMTMATKRFNQSVEARITDISPGGAFIQTVPEREGRIIDFSFSLPSDPTLFSVTARVVWNSKSHHSAAGFGVRFLKFHQGSADALRHAISLHQNAKILQQQKAAFLIQRDSLSPETDFFPNEINSVIEIYWQTLLGDP